ncbi:hypothetical protein [Actinoplanes sp. NPDC048796]|uniref:hypothetical protein n=1 Tax=unclassified Actinoplanes TaxID=2626549 RepID=UPI0033E452BD
MAATKTAKSRNETPNTPDVSESKIARMKAADLRRELKNRGVKNTDDLKKPELVKKMVKAARRDAAGKNPTSRNDTPNTPDVNESEIARLKVPELRARLSARGVKGTGDLKKPELVAKLVKTLTKGKPTTSGGASASGGKRTGKKASKSLQYSQEIKSTSEKPERLGRSLVTTDHEVIRQWAKARKAVPATIAGTQHDGHLGVLRFDFPGYDESDRLVEVSWSEWFEAFDKRRLNFIYQQRLTSGKRSNFFQLENPDE